MFGTTREFLDYFGLKKLDDLPPLSEIADLVDIAPELGLPEATPQVDLIEALSAEEDEQDAAAAELDEAGRTQEAAALSEDNVVPISRKESGT